MKGHNFQYHNKPYRALAPQTVTDAATVNGDDISEPWRIGRQLSFILLGGALPAGITAATFTVQGKKISDGSYEAIKAGDGVTDLTFTAAKTIDAGELDGGRLLGTIPLNLLNLEAYSALRLSLTTAGTGAYLVAAAAVLSELVSFPAPGVVDDLFDKVRG